MIRRARRLAAVTASVLLLATLGCRQRVDANALTGPAACAALDSLLSATGPPRPFAMSGEALLDVEQFRFRGHFEIGVAEGGETVIELGGSTLFGGHREDVAVSLAADTLRVFDRERARFYEGEALDELIRDATRARADWAKVVAQVLALAAPCDDVTTLVRDEDGARAVGPRGTIRVDVDGGRATRTMWPDPVDGSTLGDRLEVRYEWRDGNLARITASLPARGWRVRLTAK
ncbi:MAG TPA: hypothetical protein VEC56_07410 [Candidatus Krumholzibacteria bacterium]|nr:hypothetical protein [Candidatus Krumholzibacteria bacterium]